MKRFSDRPSCPQSRSGRDAAAASPPVGLTRGARTREGPAEGSRHGMPRYRRAGQWHGRLHTVRFADQFDCGLASDGPPKHHRTPLAQLRRAEGDSAVIREELSRLFTLEERHRRLFARLLIAFGLSIVIFAVGTVLIWAFESGQKGGSIHGFGDAAFFCSVQLLTVSSSMTNPLTPVGKIVDVVLEAWAIFVVTAIAGSFATFFSSGDTS